MSISETEVEEYIEELDGMVEEVLADLKSFFWNIDIKTDSSFPGEVTNRWGLLSTDETKTQQNILETYQEWYGGAKTLVAEYMQEDEDEFRELREEFTKLVALDYPPPSGQPMDTYSEAHKAIVVQRGIVNGIPRKIEAERYKARKQVSMSLSKDELQRARELLAEGLPRASGITAGVALERHLLTMCEEAEEDLEYAVDDGITSLATTLYKAEEIEKTTLKSLELLGGIRNDCAHANQTEPSEHKVRRLIDDTDDYIRGRGL